MAEIAGLVMGGATFEQSIAAFNAFRPDARIGTEFGIDSLKVALLQLRLLRWKDTLENTFNNSDNVAAISRVKYAEIETLLKEMLEDLLEAEAASRRYERLPIEEESHAIESESIAAVTKQVLALSLRRARKPSSVEPGRQRVTWFLKDRRKLRSLIERLNQHVDDLDALTPDLKSSLEKAAREEAQEIIEHCREGSSEDSNLLSAPWLSVVVSSVDERIGTSFKQESSTSRMLYGSAVEPTEQRTSVRGNLVSYGDVYVAHQDRSMHAFKQGDARVQYGDSYGGKSVFDD